MKECIHKKFILDGEIVDCELFSLKMIDEGTSIYEVVRVINGKILFARDHLLRLEQSVRLEGQDIWQTLDSLNVMISHLPALNGIMEGNIKLVFNYNPDNQNKFLAYFVTHDYPDTDQYNTGVRLHTYRFTRTEPHKKIWRPKHRSAVKEYMRENDIYEVLLVDDQDRVTEASKANIFFVSGEEVITPPIDLVLPGITRKYLLDIGEKQGIHIKEAIIHQDQLETFDAAFLTGTSPKVLPVSHVNECNFNVDHPILRIFMKQYDRLIESALKSRFGSLQSGI
jgi:branched-chain amino acid aminotransferase